MSLDVADLKNQGNSLVKSKKYKEAVEVYRSALNACSSNDLAVTSILWANMALCYIQQEEWMNAEYAATQALQADKVNIKALYRRAIAREKLGQLDSALRDVADVLRQDPVNQEALMLLQRLREATLAQKDKAVDEHLPATLLKSVNLLVDRLEAESDVVKITDQEATEVENFTAVLRGWIVQRKKPDVILRDGVVTTAGRLLTSLSPPLTEEEKVTSPTNRPNIDQDMNVLRCHAAIFRLLTLMVMVLTDEGDENDHHRRLLFDKPLVIPDIVRKARECVSSAVPPRRLLSFLQFYIRSGVTQLPHPSPSMQTPVILRSYCSGLVLNCLQYTSDLDNPENLKAIVLGTGCFESCHVVRAALQALGHQADSRRRYGSRVKALNKSQELVAVMEAALQQLDSESREVQQDAEFAITSLFLLFADKDRSPQDQLSVEGLASLLLGPYLVEGKDMDDYAIGLRGLLLLWMADREAVHSFVGSTDLLPMLLNLTLETTGTREACCVQQLAAELLMHCMEYPDLRAQLLDGDAIEKLCNFCSTRPKSAQRNANLKAKVAVALARMAVHSDDVRVKLFTQFDFLRTATECLRESGFEVPSDRTSEQQHMRRNCLELLLFLSLHGHFKEHLLNEVTSKTTTTQGDSSSVVMSLPRLGVSVLQSRDMIGLYYFATMLCNLLRSRNDKETIRRPKDPGAPQLDPDQIQALREFFDKLPEHSRPTQSGKFDRGEESIVQALIKKLVSADIATCLSQMCVMKPPPTLNIFAMATEALALLARHVDHRHAVAKAGGIAAFLAGAEAFAEAKIDMYEGDLARCRQGLAHLCISLNPNLLSYRETMDITPHMIELLRHSYELYQYEGALALTNLLSFSEEARNHVFHSGAMSTLMDCATSDNELCRAAGLECMCNMALCEAFKEKVASGGHITDLQLLLAFLGETENERAQSAAAGCLAMLTTDLRIVICLMNISNVRNIIKAVTNHEDFYAKPGFQLRILTILNNICELSTMEIPPESKADLQIPETLKTFAKDGLVALRSLDQTKIENKEVLTLLSSTLKL